MVILFFSTGTVFAYRPFTTEDSGVAGKGVLQTEGSYDYFNRKNGDTDQSLLLVAPIYGPTESLVTIVKLVEIQLSVQMRIYSRSKTYKNLLVDQLT